MVQVGRSNTRDTLHRGPRTLNQSRRISTDSASTTTTVTRQPFHLICPMLSYGELNRNLKRFVNDRFYRICLFVSNDRKLTTDHMIYKKIKTELGLDGQNSTSCLGWWNTTGKKTYMKTLNAKRTTLSSAIKAQFKSKLTNMYFSLQKDD